MDLQDDQLAHEHVADQLGQLVTTVPTPTNIALYGPWGSGKSGIANLLANRLRDRPGVSFVRFDAFKYAENPLRRNFISAVATELGIKDSSFHGDLYTGTSSAHFSLSGKDVRRLVRLYLCMFLLVCATALFLPLVAALFSEGSVLTEFLRRAPDALRTGIAPAALLAALVVLVNRTFTVERKTDAVSSDEQFEQLFVELIKGSGTNRLVVFVDELDRCAPGNVVAALDALRTFLGVDRCVFVVAADQQVLEEALTKASEQATPADTRNPYYSSGSGYLDKVFQYQVSVPPLLSQRVSHFAAALVRGRPGVWAQVDIDVVVSILVPSHVTSPRRVKALLNTFVLTFRLAQQRRTAGLLDCDLHARADEIARLVCLRVEFPLFARDLLLDHALPDYVLALLEDPEAELGPYVTEDIREIASKYAKRQTPVDRLLADTTAEDSTVPRAGNDTEPPGVDGRAGAAPTGRVQARHGRQLLDYLERTRSVPPPGRDLLFLQNSGSVFGLSAALAETIEQHAQNGALAQLRATVEPLNPADRQAVLALLTQQARTELGVAAANVAAAVLFLYADADADPGTGADAAVEALAPVLARNSDVLRTELLPGAWRLALASRRPAARKLRTAVLQHPTPWSHASTTAWLLRDSGPALEADAVRVRDLLCHHLVSSEAPVLTAVLKELAPATAEQLAKTLSPYLGKRLRKAIEDHDAAQTAAPATTAPAPVAPAAAPPAAATAAVFDPAPTLAALDDLLGHWADQAPAAAQQLMVVLLDAARAEGNGIVETHLAKLGPVRDGTTARRVLDGAARRLPGIWPLWLGAIDPHLPMAELNEPLTALLEQLWGYTAKRPADEIRGAADAYTALVGDQLTPGLALTPIVLEALRDTVDGDETAEAHQALLKRAEPFLGSGLVDPVELAGHECSVLTGVLQLGGDKAGADDALLQYVTTVAPSCFTAFGHRTGVVLGEDAATAMIQAVDDCGWIPDPQHTALTLATRRAADSHLSGATTLRGLPSADSMRAFFDAHGALADLALTDWIALDQPSGGDLTTASVQALRSTSPPPSSTLLAEVRRRLAGLPAAEQTAFWRALIGDKKTAPTSHTVLVHAGWTDLPDHEAASLIADRAAQCTNNPERRTVLALWQEAGITQSTHRKRLLEEVLLPLLDPKNISATELVLEFLPRLADPIPPGMKNQISRTVEQATAANEKLHSRAIRALTDLGYTTQGTGWFGRRQKIRTEPEA
ncbi:P-loop NTPase fold protein [Kitasatospora purpeofusca]|uniref:P-loop NTPase fold protein n=1 Tax=Kitasatospora purpeofusca TaxID=67352 RepID=UPI00386F8FAC|nr:KAP family NTPase [Kitasatospora purpeofusca]